MVPALIAIALSFNPIVTVRSQEPSSNTTPDEKKEKEKAEKAERDAKAFALLEQIVNDSQLLRLPENRISVQINTADLLWDRNQGRARTLFTGAGDALAELMRNAATPNEQRQERNRPRSLGQLRQDLVLNAARHDAPLAYQLLAITRPPAPPATTEVRNPNRPDSEDVLEQALLSRIAAVDPKMALQNAELMLEKGQYPRTLPAVMAQLQRKDKEAAAKLEDKVLKKLQSTNLLSSSEAVGLSMSLLRPGPRTEAKAAVESTPAPTSTQTTAGQINIQTQYLAQSGYVDLMNTVIDAALKATPPAGGNNQRGLNNQRGRPNAVPIDPLLNSRAQPTEAQVEQANARALLGGLQMVLPQIDQNVPTRAQAVREKLTEVGIDSQRNNMNQVGNLLRQGTTDSLMNAAQTAPAQLQPRIYQQAALKALDEGNVDRARQIASDYLKGTSRDRVLQQVEFRQISEKTEATKLDELRQTLAGLSSDDERIDLLMVLSSSVKEKNPKLAIQMLDQAKQLTSRRAVNYQQFDQQLRVAEAFRPLDVTRSFEVLEPGILQLNELLSAAATLSGFETNVFSDGELPLHVRSGLSNMVVRYGQALSALARSDFDRAQSLAGRFQLTESRILARMALVQGVLGRSSGPGVPIPPNIGVAEPGFRP
jgi:hypothetical protein